MHSVVLQQRFAQVSSVSAAPYEPPTRGKSVPQRVSGLLRAMAAITVEDVLLVALLQGLAWFFLSGFVAAYETVSCAAQF